MLDRIHKCKQIRNKLACTVNHELQTKKTSIFNDINTEQGVVYKNVEKVEVRRSSGSTCESLHSDLELRFFITEEEKEKAYTKDSLNYLRGIAYSLKDKNQRRTVDSSSFLNHSILEDLEISLKERFEEEGCIINLISMEQDYEFEINLIPCDWEM
jgi:hypothetical protein